MTTFEVWAPGHQRVDLLLGPSARLPMEAGKFGWWRFLAQETEPGTRYSFSLDGGPGRPDPRSPWQPDGVDAPSAVVDQSGFPWDDGGWAGFDLATAIIYEMHVGTFSEEGTFDGAIEHLDHLVDLGVTAVEVHARGRKQRGAGMGVRRCGLWAPHHAYGGPEGLKRLGGRLPRPRASPSCSTSSTTTSGRRATISASSGRISPTGTGRPGDRRSTWTVKAVTGPATS